MNPRNGERPKQGHRLTEGTPSRGATTGDGAPLAGQPGPQPLPPPLAALDSPVPPPPPPPPQAVLAAEVAIDGGLQSEVWGHFSINVRRPSAICKFGAWQAVCRYHRKNVSTGCKKQVGLLSPSAEHKELALWQVRHWCNQAVGFLRQKHHVAYQPTLAALPSQEDIERQKITDPAPPEEAMADVDMSDQEPVGTRRSTRGVECIGGAVVGAQVDAVGPGVAAGGELSAAEPAAVAVVESVDSSNSSSNSSDADSASSSLANVE